MTDYPKSTSNPPGRRVSNRYPLNADVEILEPVKANGVVINASEGGLLVAIDKELKTGTVCVISIDVDEQKTVEFARVTWSRQHPDGCLVGFCFVDEI